MIFVLLLASFCLAIIALTIFQYLLATRRVNKRSLKGLVGIQQLIALIRLTQQHRGMHSGVLNGATSFLHPLDSLKKEIALSYHNLLKFEQSCAYPNHLSVQSQYTQWQYLIQLSDLSSKDSFQIHSRIIARLLDNLWNMSDEFNLTSNRKQKVKALAIQCVKTLPEITEALGQLRALSVQVAAKKRFHNGNQQQLIFTIKKIDEHLAQIDSHLSQQDKKQLTAFVEQMKQEIHSQHLTNANPHIIFQDASLIIDRLFNNIFTELNTLQTTIHTH